MPIETLDEKIDRYSEIYKVSSSTMRHIVSRESGGKRDALGDAGYKCPSTGRIAPSRGIVQINECWHPNVTIEQAFDIDFSLNFLARHLKDGKCYLWSTCPYKKTASGS